MKKKPFDSTKQSQFIRVQIRGKLRAQLYLYMEDNDCTITEAIKDGIRVVTTRQSDDLKKGRKPK